MGYFFLFFSPQCVHPSAFFISLLFVLQRFIQRLPLFNGNWVKQTKLKSPLPLPLFMTPDGNAPLCPFDIIVCAAEAHAALTAVQWQLGQADKAEEHFAIATSYDSRWKRVSFIQTQTRWPPKLYAAMEKFLSIVPG